MTDKNELDELQRKFEELQRKAEEIDDDNDVPLDEVFPEDFLLRHSKFSSFNEMITASGFTIISPEDIINIPNGGWDKFIKESTSFECWNDMLGAASQEWISKQLGLG